MSTALPGEHLCADHQGNHSHYDKKNCTVCKLEARLLHLDWLQRSWTGGTLNDSQTASDIEALCAKHGITMGWLRGSGSPELAAILRRLDAAVAERDALRADAERLDWLDKQVSDSPGGRRLYCLPGALRKAIDAARGGA